MIPVYNVTLHKQYPLTWREIMEKGRKKALKYPFELMLWYPTGTITSSPIIHAYNMIFYHWVPAYLIDAIMFLLGQKRL